METKCLECGNSVPQTLGKRKKEYCGSTCRTVYWKKKKQKGKPKRGPGRPPKAPIIEPIPERDNILINAARGRDSNGINMDEVRLAEKEAQKEDKPFPANWESMGKIEKLKWLTANQ